MTQPTVIRATKPTSLNAHIYSYSFGAHLQLNKHYQTS